MESFEVSSTTPLTVAARIEHLLCEVIGIQKKYVEAVCPACERPCCTRVGRLFDEKDLVFAMVLGLSSVSCRKHKGKDGCPHLSPTGCILDPKLRPFTCHRYLCSQLKEEMTRKNPGLVSLLERKFRTLERLRGELLAAFIQYRGSESTFPCIARRRP